MSAFDMSEQEATTPSASIHQRVEQPSDVADPGVVFQRLAHLIYQDTEPKAVHQALVVAARELIDGCDHATLMIATHGRFETVAATDETAALIDSYERELGTGPCLDAILDEAFQLDADLQERSQWPELAARVLSATPVRGMLGYRLMADERKVGALNVFSDTPGALNERSANQGAVVAAFASVSMMMLSAKDQADTMRLGLDSNREIGKAIGLLMAAHHFTEEEAFALLRKTSQNLNMKISAVARKIIEGQQVQYSPNQKPTSR